MGWAVENRLAEIVLDKGDSVSEIRDTSKPVSLFAPEQTAPGQTTARACHAAQQDFERILAARHEREMNMFGHQGTTPAPGLPTARGFVGAGG
jgi:hypothetical protein